MDSGATVDILIKRIQDIAVDMLENYILPVAGALVVLLIIWAGIKYITGGPKVEESAKKTLAAVFIGIAIILLSLIIINVVQRFFIILPT
jgi:hypothetical protein